MDTTTVQLTVPKGLAPYLDETEQTRTRKMFAMMLYPYIEDMTISHGRAAEILGMNKIDLIDLYCGMGLPYIHQSAADLEEELAAFHQARREK
ncbi:MAG: UPF0175 family protein [Clostridia bacterium]|nr:UPF0175 family protein [Clostridia bacterium]